MLTSLLEGVLICSVTWFLWKYFRQVFVKSPLDNIPGPPAKSFLYGEQHFLQMHRTTYTPCYRPSLPIT